MSLASLKPAVGVLSAFENQHLSPEDKQAIIEGGCHVLCGIQITTDINSEDDDKVEEDNESLKSSPCVKGPYDKPARFISAMPSTIMPDDRQGPSSTMPRFSRRRCAAEYKQSREPLPLVHCPPRRIATHPSSSMSQQKASTMLNSHSMDSNTITFVPSHKDLEFAHSKLNAECSTNKVMPEHGTQKVTPDTATKHQHRHKIGKNGEMSNAMGKGKKAQGRRKFSSRFSSLFRKQGSV